MGWGYFFSDIICTAHLTIPKNIEYCYTVADEINIGLNKLELLMKLFQDSHEQCTLVLIHGHTQINQFTH